VKGSKMSDTKSVVEVGTQFQFVDGVTGVPSVVGKPVQNQCAITLTYQPGRPDVPTIQMVSGDCALGADVALAAALSVILKNSFFVPIPVPK
jgi:hypothetical protein